MLKDSYIIINIILSLILIIIFSNLAKKILLVDQPGPRKIHKGEVPIIGGIVIFISIFSFSGILGYSNWFVNLIYIGFIILILGVFDDIYNLNQYLRLLIQAICSYIICQYGIKITTFGDYSYLPYLSIISFSTLITILSVIIYTNAINFIDGIDGLAASQSILSLSFLLFYLNFVSFGFETYFIKVFIISLLIFLIFNLNFKFIKLIFLGDSGSTFIGFLIAWLLIYYSSVVIHVMHPALVLFCISLPLFDFLFIFYFRIKNRLNPLKSDNFHFHHTLLKLNYNKYQIIMISSLISVFIFASGMLINFFIIKDFLILAIILYFAMYFIIMNKLQKNIKKALNRHH